MRMMIYWMIPYFYYLIIIFILKLFLLPNYYFYIENFLFDLFILKFEKKTHFNVKSIQLHKKLKSSIKLYLK